jgi:GNAT superfamily N-acetyltransferase
MNIIEQNRFIRMERADLRDVPQFELPPDFIIRWFEDGDESLWLEIHEQAEKFAEVSLSVYRREFGDDVGVLNRRQCFLINAEGRAIATASAWMDDDYWGRPYGRVHWVAVVPDCQGRGLSKPLISAVLFRMIQLGHQHVYLRTSTARLPAINLYAGFGFTPSLRTEEDQAIWSQLNPLLPNPFDLQDC